jgi:hypothetical protein
LPSAASYWTLNGGFSSADDLVARGLVDRLTAEAVRDRLIFLR